MTLPADGKVIYVPTPLHVDAYARARELGYDLLLHDDPRALTWFEYADAIVWRQGKISSDGPLSLPLVRPIHAR